MRAAHSLKGAARIVGVNAAVRVAHAMEDCLVAAQHGKVEILPHHIDILLQRRRPPQPDRIGRRRSAHAWETAHEEAIAAMEAKLAAILSGEAPRSLRPPSGCRCPSPSLAPVLDPPAPTPPKPAPVSDDLSGFSMMELFRTEADSQTATPLGGG